MTAKQILLAHLNEYHKKVRTTGTLAILRRDHARDHHRYGGALKHYHDPANRPDASTPPSAGNRPYGWSTGEDVVLK